MRYMLSAAFLLGLFALPGCDGGSGPAEAKKLQLTDAEAAAIAKADQDMVDEEQGQKITKPTKGAAKKK